MNKLTSALAAVLVLGSASVALAGNPSIDATARYYGPLVNQSTPFTTKNVGLPHNVGSDSSWMDRASQSFDGGGY
jgi:hypothetical protein